MKRTAIAVTLVLAFSVAPVARAKRAALDPSTQLTAPGRRAAIAVNDLRVTETIYEGVVPFGHTGTVWDGQPVMIGDDLTYFWEIVNEGPDPAGTFTFSFFQGESMDHREDPARLRSGTFDDEHCRSSGSGSREITCSGADRVIAYAWVTANAPGDLDAPSVVTSADFDPDPADNSTSSSVTIACSINGTDENDRLVGTDAIDSICGWGGDDHITAVGEDDFLFGHDGNDTFDGIGPTFGTVKWEGGPGVDTVSFLDSEGPIRTCFANVPFELTERFIGSQFDDWITGYRVGHVVMGAGGDDILIGGKGQDELRGGPGADRLVSTEGDFDQVFGGPDRDLARADQSDEVTSASRATSRIANRLC